MATTAAWMLGEFFYCFYWQTLFDYKLYTNPVVANHHRLDKAYDVFDYPLCYAAAYECIRKHIKDECVICKTK